MVEGVHMATCKYRMVKMGGEKSSTKMRLKNGVISVLLFRHLEHKQKCIKQKLTLILYIYL